MVKPATVVSPTAYFQMTTAPSTAPIIAQTPPSHATTRNGTLLYPVIIGVYKAVWVKVPTLCTTTARRSPPR